MQGLFYGAKGKFTWRMLAAVLGGQSLVIFLGAQVARGLAVSGQDFAGGNRYLLIGCGLACLCLLAAGMMRRPWGLTLGWLIQALTLLSAFVVPMMLIVGLIFLALWVTCLLQGMKVDRLDARRAADRVTP